MKTRAPFVALSLALSFALFIAAPAARAELGRLFFTPEKRAALSEARKLRVDEKQLEPAKRLRYDGLIQGPRGATTLWLNGNPQPADSAPAGVRIETDNRDASITVAPAEGGPQHKLKIGETWNEAPRKNR